MQQEVKTMAANSNRGARRRGRAILASLCFAPVVMGIAGPTLTAGQPDGTTGRAPEAVVRQHIDRAWVQKTLINDMLDHWLAASVMPNGFIQENLDREWKPWGTQREASLNGQGRMTYALVEGYEYTHDQRY